MGRRSVECFGPHLRQDAADTFSMAHAVRNAGFHSRHLIAGIPILGHRIWQWNVRMLHYFGFVPDSVKWSKGISDISWFVEAQEVHLRARASPQRRASWRPRWVQFVSLRGCKETGSKSWKTYEIVFIPCGYQEVFYHFYPLDLFCKGVTFAVFFSFWIFTLAWKDVVKNFCFSPRWFSFIEVMTW